MVLYTNGSALPHRLTLSCEQDGATEKFHSAQLDMQPVWLVDVHGMDLVELFYFVYNQNHS